MTDPAIIAASYAAERNYSHNPDDVIDASDAVGAWGTAKESTTELVDLSGNLNIAAIKGPMPTEGFIQGRRFGGIRDYLDCGNDSSLNVDPLLIRFVGYVYTPSDSYPALIEKGSGDWGWDIVTHVGYVFGFNEFNQYKFKIGDGTVGWDSISFGNINNKFSILEVLVTSTHITAYKNGVLHDTIERTKTGSITSLQNLNIGRWSAYNRYSNANIMYVQICNSNYISSTFFNTLARLPFWSVNYTDYPDNVTEYTDNLPYSSSIISSGTFKVDDDKLQCVSAGTMTYSASYEFDGSEYIKVEIDGVEYAGTGTITQGNTTVSVAQGSNKVTIVMGTGDSIEGEIGIQFREEV